MNKLLDKFGIEIESELSLLIEKNQFIKILSKHLDIDKFNLFEIFSKSNNKYKGTIEANNLVIKRKRRLFGSRFVIKAKGSFSQDDDSLNIKFHVTSWNWYVTVMYVFIAIFYFIVFLVLFTSMTNSKIEWVLFPLILLHMLLMIGGPLLLLKKATKLGEQQLRTDLIDFIHTSKNRLT